VVGFPSCVKLSQQANCTASELATQLDFNHVYLSRILRRFQSLGFITKKRSAADGRQIAADSHE
jgi:DNA-binding MarR family transcriptional regulator